MSKGLCKTELDFNPRHQGFKHELRNVFTLMFKLEGTLLIGVLLRGDPSRRLSQYILRQRCTYDRDEPVDHYLGFISITGNIEYYILAGNDYEHDVEHTPVV